MPTRTFIQPTVGTGLSCIFEMVNKSADEWSKILVPSHLRWRGWFLRAADQWVAFLRSHGLWQTMTNLYRYAWPQPAEPHPAKVVWSILKQCLNTLRLSSLSFSSLSLSIYLIYLCVWLFSWHVTQFDLQCMQHNDRCYISHKHASPILPKHSAYMRVQLLVYIIWIIGLHASNL